MTAAWTLLQRLTTHQTSEEEEVHGNGDNLNSVHRTAGAVLRGGARKWPRPLCEKVWPLWPSTAPSKVNNDAGILLNYVVIASNVYM